MTAEKTRGTSPGLVVVGILALVQGVLGLLRAAHLVQIGSDLADRGLLLLPIIGAIAFVRAGLVAILALLFVVEAWGLFGRRAWARGLGLTIAIVTLILGLLALLGGMPPAGAAFWAIVPVVLLVYLLGPAGRR